MQFQNKKKSRTTFKSSQLSIWAHKRHQGCLFVDSLVIIFLDNEILWCFSIWVPFGEVKKKGCTMEAAGKSACVWNTLYAYFHGFSGVQAILILGPASSTFNGMSYLTQWVMIKRSFFCYSYFLILCRSFIFTKMYFPKPSGKLSQ